MTGSCCWGTVPTPSGSWRHATCSCWRPTRRVSGSRSWRPSPSACPWSPRRSAASPRWSSTGGRACWCHRGRPRELADAVATLLTDDEPRQRMAEAAAQRGAELSIDYGGAADRGHVPPAGHGRTRALSCVRFQASASRPYLAGRRLNGAALPPPDQLVPGVPDRGSRRRSARPGQRGPQKHAGDHADAARQSCPHQVHGSRREP